MYFFCPQEEYIPQVMLSSSPSPPTPSRDDSYAWPSAASAKIPFFPTGNPVFNAGREKESWLVATQIFFYFHPENWGRFPFWLIFFRWVGSTTNQKGLVEKKHAQWKTYEKSWNPQFFWPGICLANILILSDSYGFIRNEESSPFMESPFMESLIVERNHAYTQTTLICCPCEYDIFVHPLFRCSIPAHHLQNECLQTPVQSRSEF